MGKQQMEVGDFGSAIKALKAGYKVAREGWNGKGMFLFLNRGSFNFNIVKSNEEIEIAECYTIDGVCKELFDNDAKSTITRLPNINMQSATGSIITGWSASQTDVLAEDWTIVN